MQTEHSTELPSKEKQKHPLLLNLSSTVTWTPGMPILREVFTSHEIDSVVIRDTQMTSRVGSQLGDLIPALV